MNREIKASKKRVLKSISSEKDNLTNEKYNSQYVQLIKLMRRLMHYYILQRSKLLWTII